MNLLFECLEGAYYYMMVAAIAALPLLAIVLLLDLLIGRWMSPAIRSLLWTLVALRMLIFIAPPNTAGMPNLGWALLEGGSPHEASSHRSSVPPRLESPPVIPSETLIQHVGGDLIVPTPPVASSPTPQPTDERIWQWQEIVILCLFLIWPVGVLVLFGRSVVASLRFAWQLRHIPSASDSSVLEVLDEVCQTMLVRRAPKVKYVPQLSCPALFGCFRPTLCLPVTTDPLSRDELRMVLIHELAHLVRYDAYVAWLLKLVQAIHWVNPLAWFVIRQVAHTRELACDEAVRRFTASAEHPSYGELIVRFAAVKPSAKLGLVGLWFARPKRRLRSRIAACAASRKRRWRLPRLVALVLLAIVACVGLTDRAPSSVVTAPVAPEPIAFSPELVAKAEAAMARHRDPRPVGSELVELRVYDIAPAMKKLAEGNPKAEPLEWLLTHIRPDGNNAPKPALVAIDRDAGTITLRMSRNEHATFTDALAGIERSGSWNVEIEVRFLLVASLEHLGALRWSVADSPYHRMDSHELKLPHSSALDVNISMTSIATSQEPFTSAMLTHDQLHHAIRILNRDRRGTILKAPRVMLSNGTQAIIRDQSYAPYIIGMVHANKGQSSELTPVVSVLREGTQLELRGEVVDADTLELSCRGTFSEILSVAEGHLPGTDHIVQVPKVHEVLLHAHQVTFAPGESLVIAPISRMRERNGPIESLCLTLTPIWTPATMPSPSTPVPYIDETK